MNIKCSSCNSILHVDESKYKQESLIVQCPNCNQKIRVQLSIKNQTEQPAISNITQVVDETTPSIDTSNVWQNFSAVQDREIPFLMYVLFAVFLFFLGYAVFDFFIILT